ncbi:MAG: NAD(P)H:quinone oxidoreductase type IV [Comamonas sp.]|nr:NAD(P)H:quinone oxidoreductase type IV [Comamonas sp.]
MSVRLVVLYYSTYGTNHEMAEIAAQAARDAGAEVRLLQVPETAPQAVVEGQPAWLAQQQKTAHIPKATPADMEWANAYLISAPTRFGTLASQMHAFIDTLGGLWAKGGLANKAVSAMTSAQNTHGGQEATLLGFYTSVMHWGGMVVAPGFTDPAIFKTGGNAYGYSHTQGKPFGEEAKASISYQARRLVQIGGKLVA